MNILNHWMELIMAYKTFCIFVFFIQLVIAAINFHLSKRHELLCKHEHSVVDFLCGVSWTMTGLWWLYCAITG